MLKETLSEISRAALPIWLAGGWGMIALAVDGMVIFLLGFSILFRLLEKGVMADPAVAWGKWQRDPTLATGPLSRIIAGALVCRDLPAMASYFAALHGEEFAPFARNLRVMKVAVAVAPLLGLLGTVTGMLTTFRALATGGGGDKTMGMIAGGISEALITTETGLVLALSGMIFQFVLTRQHEKFNKKIAHLETQCMQRFRADAVPLPVAA
jgi:biopolymer transport protein ExbB